MYIDTLLQNVANFKVHTSKLSLYLFFDLLICVLATPQINSWQLETTTQEITNTVNTPMDCKGKIYFLYIICKNKHIMNNTIFIKIEQIQIIYNNKCVFNMHE